MAYKPKYAQTKASPGKPAMGQTQPNREEPGQKPKKMGRKLLIFFIILGKCGPSEAGSPDKNRRHADP